MKYLFLLLLLFGSAPAFASRPGGGSEGPDQCTVMGEVVQIKENNTAVVRLKQVAGSTTYNGCSATGAQTMADKNAPAIVSLDINPAPVITVGDVVFVNIRSDKDMSFETFPAGEYTMNQLMGEAQIYFEDRMQRLQIIYAVKSFFGVDHVVESLEPDLVDADKEKRLSAALMLIILADAKLPVPSQSLQQALRIGLLESRQSAVGASIRLYPGDRAQVVNVLIGLLHDKEVVDPFATIVAMGEMGEEAARALPDAIDRINDSYASQLRSDGDTIFAAAVEKMKAEDKAAQIFMAKANGGKLKAADGPLAKGMCRLKKQSADLAAWCKGSNNVDRGCVAAVEQLADHLASIPNTCTKDDDCTGYYFPTGAPECPPAQMFPKSVMTGDAAEKAEKLTAMVKVACAKDWENKHAVCSPPVWHPACREGKCVDAK